ncbi:Mismatch repair protein msh3, partial [Physocladia obscura]
MLGKKAKPTTATKQATISSFFVPKQKQHQQTFAREQVATAEPVNQCPNLQTQNIEECPNNRKHQNIKPYLETEPESEVEPELRQKLTAGSKRIRNVIGDSDNEEQNESLSPLPTKRNRIELIDSFRYSDCPLEHEPDFVTQESQIERQQMRYRFLKRFSLISDTMMNSQSQNTFFDEDAEDMPIAASNSQNTTTTARKFNSAVKTKYTPLEQQYLDIRKKYPGVLLVVEVGYKFRFFEEDALTASKELNIVAYMDKNLRGASIPTHRLNVHVSKLVHLGYKVGIVRQTETAALKAVGDNKSAPFTRKLTNIFTKGTFIDTELSSATLDSSDAFESSKSSFIMVLFESPPSKTAVKDEFATSAKTVINFVAVQISTGDIVYDSFEDGTMRTELETRLEHLCPVELILPTQLMSSATERLLKHWAERSEIKNGDLVRVERLKDSFLAGVE